MNTELKNKLKQTLRDNKVKVWFNERDSFGNKVEDRTFLSFSDLSDKELGSLFSDVKFGMNDGLLWVREDRTESLNWAKF